MAHMGSRPFYVLKIVILFVSVAAGAQEALPDIRVELPGRARTISQVLDKISLQSGYDFTYDADLFPGDRKVNLDGASLPMQAVLDSLFRYDSLSYRVIGRNIVIFRMNEQPPSPLIPEIDRALVVGRITDQRSGKALPYATIALFGSSLGSVSNQDGSFSFKIPPDMSNPLLVVSYMGYKSRYVSLSYPTEDALDIGLERETIPLQEVIIRYTDPAFLLQEALAKIQDNYLQEYSHMTAYYRESVRRDDHCMVFSEAVLEVAKSPYSPALQSDQARILKGRKITDTERRDTVLIKLSAGIHTSLNLDVVKNRPDFLGPQLLEYYDLEFNDIMTYRDRLVYVINFRQKEHIRELMFQGKVYLDQENLAILAVDFEYNPDLIQKEPGIFLVNRSPGVRIRPVFARYHVDYREIDGSHYISQVRAEVEMKVRRKRRWMGSRYGISVEMAVTDVDPGQRIRINREERVRQNTIVSDEPFVLDPLFWGIYNTIEPENSLRESIERIEHSIQEITQ